MSFAARNEEYRRQRAEDAELQERYDQRLQSENEETEMLNIQPHTPAAQSDCSSNPEALDDPSLPAKAKTVADGIRKHFLIIADGRQKCAYCAKTYSANSSTTTLSYHLKVNHNAKWKEACTGVVESKPVPACFRPTNELSTKINRDVQKEGEDLLARLLTGCSLPFSIVDRKELQEFVGCLNGNFKIPSRNTMKQRILKSYREKKAEIIALLKRAPGRFTITLDGWTSNTSEAYFPICAHWMDSDWKKSYVLLDFVYIQERHTAENVCKLVMDVVKEFQIQDRIIAIVTDGASNMKSACEKAGLLLDCLKRERQQRGKGNQPAEVWLRCLSHALHLSVMAGVEKKNDSVSHLREVVVALKRPRAMEDFRMAAHRKNIGLELDCRTRWNSIEKMCRAALSIRAELDEYFASATGLEHLIITDEEWQDIAELVALLEPYGKASVEFSSSSEPTMHLGIPYLVEIKRHLTEKKLTSEADWIRAAAEAMIVPIDKALLAWKKDIVLVSQVLDPAFKDTSLTEAEKAHVRSSLKLMMPKYATPDRAATTSSTGTAKQPTTMRELLISQRLGGQAAAIDEVEEYLNTAPVYDLGILDYWRNARKYPVLQRIALDLLAIPVSSTQPERENSKAKYVITDQRNRISGACVQATLCLKSWHGVITNKPLIYID